MRRNGSVADSEDSYLHSSTNPLRVKLTKPSNPKTLTKKTRKLPREIPMAVSNPGLLKKLQAELEALVGSVKNIFRRFNLKINADNFFTLLHNRRSCTKRS